MALAPGTRLGPYEIQAPLGTGGMGEVYRARDTKLNRHVALKVLPDAFAHDPERVARFKREAQVLASLSHPNIAALYGMEEFEGQQFLVMQLVEGDTLADRLTGRPLGIKLQDTLAIARQLAEALEAAHENGVVHRDLKPANIKITPAGVVTVLDFGLATTRTDIAAVDQMSAPTVSAGPTAYGTVVGTVPYMSPEQARGQTVDKRTDIWAFGCVLYEMLTGRRAFRGATTSDVLVAILERTPDWTALLETTPMPIRRVLVRCLEKDPTHRLRDIGDARIEIADATEMLREPVVAPARTNGRPRAITPWLVASLATAAAVVLGVQRFLDPVAEGPMPDMTLERITYDSGLTRTPALSPDGTLLAYSSNRGGHDNADIWVQQTWSGVPLRLTDDPFDEDAPDFSPDGSQIVFRSERDGGGVYVVPSFGGPPRLIVAEGRRPRFSPDGSSIAYWVNRSRPGTPQLAVFVISLRGGDPSRVLADFVTARDPVWAPDGRSLLVWARRDESSPVRESFDWWWVPLDGRRPVKTGIFPLLNVDSQLVSTSSWTSRGIVISGDGNLWLTQLSAADGRVVMPPRWLPRSGSAAMPAMSATGEIVFAVHDDTRVIERASLDASSAPPVRLYADEGQTSNRASETPDETVVVFEKRFPKYVEIWSLDARDGRQQMVTRVETTSSPSATVSPDGARIAYTVGNVENGAGYVIERSGGVPRSVCEHCGIRGFLVDNRRALAVFTGPDYSAIGTVDTLDGSRVETFRDRDRLERPHLSPDQRWLAFTRSGKSYLRPFAPEATGALAEQEVDATTTGRPAGWSLDSTVLYLLLRTDGFRCLWGQRVDSATGRLQGKPFVVRHFHAIVDANATVSTSFGNTITRGGFLYEKVERTGNLWRITGNPPTR